MRSIGPRVLVGFALFFWAWLVWACAGEWSSNPQYSFGWLVPPLAIYFLLRDGVPSLKRPGNSSFAVVVLWIAALLVLPIELFRLTPLYWRPVLWLIGILAVLVTFAAARILGGWQAARWCAFPCLFFLIAIPWPGALEQRTTLALMHWVAGVVVEVLRIVGIPASLAGNTIALPNCRVGVEEACSGIRSLQAAVMMSFAFGEYFRLVWLRRGILLLAGVAFALFGNLVRTFVLAIAGNTSGAEGIARIHDASGLALLVLLFVALLLASWMMAGAARGGRCGGDRTAACARASVGPWARGAILFGIVAFLSAQGWFFFRGWESREGSRPLLEDVAGNHDLPVPESVAEILAASEAAMMLSPTGKTSAYHFYWEPSPENGRQLYHRPDICMPGAGWQSAGPAEQLEVVLEGRRTEWRILPFERFGDRAFLIWGAWMDGEPVRIEFDRPALLQRDAAWEFIRTGSRRISFEVAAVLVPYQGETLPKVIAEDAVRGFFKANEDRSRS